MRSVLREIKQKVDEHLTKEIKLMEEISKANLTDAENENLIDFMAKHPIARIMPNSKAMILKILERIKEAKE